MIHYHGADGIDAKHFQDIMANRHAFVSFAMPRRLKDVSAVCASFALDNGAFTTWRQGLEFDFDAYGAWIDKHHKHPAFDWCLVPDKIEGTEHDNLKLMAEWSKCFPATISVPVWHLHEELSHLRFLCKQYPRVAFGSSGKYSSVGSSRWWNRMAEAMNHICDSQGRPPCKLHGLRMLNPKIFTAFPFASADSTMVARNSSYDKPWKGTYVPPTKIVRGIVLATRIEVFNSAPVWKKQPAQEELFLAI